MTEDVLPLKFRRLLSHKMLHTFALSPAGYSRSTSDTCGCSHPTWSVSWNPRSGAPSHFYSLDSMHNLSEPNAIIPSDGAP